MVVDLRYACDSSQVFENMKFVKHRNKWFWGHSTIIIAENGCAVCTVQFDKDFKNEAIVCGVSVFQGARNKGYGNLLLKEAEKEARHFKAKQLVLYAERTSWTKDWYIRHGFIEMPPIQSGQIIGGESADEKMCELRKPLD